MRTFDLVKACKDEFRFILDMKGVVVSSDNIRCDFSFALRKAFPENAEDISFLFFGTFSLEPLILI